MSLQLWTECGVAHGIATLGSDAKLTTAQIPTALTPGVASGGATLDSSATLTAAQIPVGVAQWSKYVVTMAAGNLLVNGVIVAAKAAATTQSLALFTKAANAIVHRCVVKHSTAFAGTSISALTASVGVSGALTALGGTALDVFQAVGSTKFTEGSGSADLASVGVVLALVATGANLSALSAGALTVWVFSSVLP